MDRAPGCGAPDSYARGDERHLAVLGPVSLELRSQLRDSFQCDCDGARRPLRVLQAKGTEQAEAILDSCEAATGTRPPGCPWRSFADPYVGEVLRAYRHWKAGQLALVWGDDPPHALMTGLEKYDAALNAVQAHDIRAERKRHEEEAKERRLKGAPKPKGRSR